MTFEAALTSANQIYLRNRRDFEPISRQKTSEDLRLIEKNRIRAFHDNLSAQWRWERRHSKR